MNKIKACVFDLDGTILNTIETVRYFSNNTLKHFGLKSDLEIKDYEYIIRFPINLYYRNLLKAANCEENTIDLILNEVMDYDVDTYNKNYMYLTKPFDGILEVFHKLKDNNIIIAILTNKNENIANGLVNNFFKSYVSLTIGQTKNSISKPEKGCFNRIFENLSLKPEEIIYIGDTETDMLAANNSNIDCGAVSWGYQNIDELKKYNPKYIFNEPNDILNILK